MYKTTNLTNGHFYLGVHAGGKTSYLGSGVVLNKAIKKYGRENFIRETLVELDSKEEMYAYEEWLVNDAMIRRPDCYNTIKGGGWHSYVSRQIPPESRKKAGDALRGRPKSAAHRKKISEGRTGIKMSEEAREKMRIRNSGSGNPRYGAIPSAETRALWSAQRKGHAQKLETCPHCGITGGVTNLKRFHFSNCKRQSST